MKTSLIHRTYWFIIRLRRTNLPARILIEHLTYFYYSVFRRKKSFVFEGKKYKYFYHLYNRTIASERIVEIPIAHKIVKQYKGKNVLEVGNVLAYYYPILHDVLDKYEILPGVINEDVISFKGNKKYDLIISVSTMEHVGWTYGEERDSGKFLRGIHNLKRSLKKGGKMVVTFPLYYRDDLSKLIKTNKMPFNKEYFMKRTSLWNEWEQIGFNEAIKGASYDSYYANANILYIGVIE